MRANSSGGPLAVNLANQSGNKPPEPEKWVQDNPEPSLSLLIVVRQYRGYDTIWSRPYKSIVIVDGLLFFNIKDDQISASLDEQKRALRALGSLLPDGGP